MYFLASNAVATTTASSGADAELLVSTAPKPSPMLPTVRPPP
jgi:hypothetical protein